MKNCEQPTKRGKHERRSSLLPAAAQFHCEYPLKLHVHGGKLQKGHARTKADASLCKSQTLRAKLASAILQRWLIPLLYSSIHPEVQQGF